MITFDAAQHKYFNADGEEYESVSKTIGRYKPKFDAEKIAGFVAKKRGVSKQEVLDEWNGKKDFACDFGHDLHLCMEQYLKGDESWRNSKFVLAVENFIPVNPLSEKSKILSEVVLRSHEYKIAGTSDVIEDCGNTFNVYDFKTNGKFEFTSYKGQMMLHPLDFLPASHFITYTIQLSIYAYLYEKMTGKTAKYLCLFHMDREKMTWTPIHVPYMKAEVMILLNNSYKQRFS